MFILIVGAKGGVGATGMALDLARGAKGIGLDLADGQLAARLERKTWTLAGLAFSTATQRQGSVDWIVHRRVTLLWTPECDLAADQAWGIVRAVADRALVVADGGIEPPAVAVELADAAIVVTDAENSPVAQYHVDRLRRQFPAGKSVVVTPYDRETVQQLVEQIKV